MTTPNDGGPAFPMEGEVYGKPDDPRWARGMSLRDYFAAKAMAAIIAHTELLSEDGEFAIGANNKPAVIMFAEFAYVMADAMLAARAKGKP